MVWICHKHICNRSENDFYWSQVHLLSFFKVIKEVSFVVFAQVQNLTHSQIGHEGQVARVNAIRPPPPSPIKLKQKGKKEGPIQNNLQLLRETQKFRNNLKEDDISWEIWVSLQDHVSFDTALTTGKQLYSCFNHRMIFPFTWPCPRVQMDSGIFLFKPVYYWNKENSCIYYLSDNDNVIYLNEFWNLYLLLIPGI